MLKMLKVVFVTYYASIWYILAIPNANESCFKHSIEYNNLNGTDYVIGGMFPLHYLSKDLYKYNPPGLMWVQAMLFAIDEINNSSTILPNIKLGYRIFDSCNTVERALQETLMLTQGILNDPTNNSTCLCDDINKSRIVALIGDAASLTTTKVASLLTATTTPQISYSATSTVLSNKLLYKSFMRTIPPDNFQAILIADLFKQFGWRYVNVVACDDEYGRIGVDELLPRLKEQDICLAVYEVYDVKNDHTKEMTRATMRKLKDEEEATVVVLWCQRPEALEVLKIAEEMKVYHRTWIATETYGKSELLFQYSSNVVQGLFGIIPAQTSYTPFAEALKYITPNNSLNGNPWLHDYWVRYKKCHWKPRVNKYLCPEQETDISNLPTNKYVNVIDGVYAIAHALDKYVKIHGKVDTIRPVDLFPLVKNVSFIGKGNTKISFDKNGDPNEATYSITNLQLDRSSNKKTFVVVGSWNGRTRRIEWNRKAIRFANFSDTVPKSSCNETCNPGFKIFRSGDKPCCWKCINCPAGEIQPGVNKDSCIPCSGDSLPNRDHTKCMKPTMKYLDPSSKAGGVIIAIMVMGYLAIITSIIIFIKHRDTPIVKASNKGLSTLQIISMLFQLSLPIFYFQNETTFELCGSRLFYYQVFYTISVSVTFTKADRLLRVFEASKSGILAKHSAMRGNSVQYVTVFLLTIVGLALSVIMFVVFEPSIVTHVTYTDDDEVYMLQFCGGNYDTILFSIVGYIVLISMVCSVYAFKARKLPQDFNEARFTSFAMFTFMLTWTMAVPIYFSQKNENGKSASWCLLSLVSTIAIFIPMYLPKCYAILFESHKNTEQRFRENLKTKRMSNVAETSSVQLSSSPIETDDINIKTN